MVSKSSAHMIIIDWIIGWKTNSVNNIMGLLIITAPTFEVIKRHVLYTLGIT